MALAEERDLYVIEDCAQAHGAQYKGRSVGSIGHIGAWSFCQDKIMTTGGEGGMVTTNDEQLWRKMWAYKDHGKSYAAVYEREHPSGYRWLHESFGTNWRMMEMQAVIGRIQLVRMSDWTAKRTTNAQMILQACNQWTAKAIYLCPSWRTRQNLQALNMRTISYMFTYSRKTYLTAGHEIVLLKRSMNWESLVFRDRPLKSI